MVIENQSINFILPMLGSDCRAVDSAIGVFIGDEVKKKGEENRIFVLCDQTDEYYVRKINNFVEHNLLLDKYTYDHYDMYMFNVPMELMPDYEKFKEGKYSEFSQAYKHHIRNFYSVRSVNYPIIKSEPFRNLKENLIPYRNYIEQVLTRSEKLYKQIEDLLVTSIPRNLELVDKPDMNQECFTQTHLKKILNLETDKWI